MSTSYKKNFGGNNKKIEYSDFKLKRHDYRVGDDVIVNKNQKGEIKISRFCI